MKVCAFEAVPILQAWRRSPVGADRVIRPWLTHQGSLTVRLQQRCQVFSVAQVQQGWTPLAADEARPLGLHPLGRVWQRDVLLCCEDAPCVFAHSVLPRQSLRGPWHDLRALDCRPLGAALFANPQVIRTSFSYRRLLPHDALYQRVARQISPMPAGLWARRSVFMLHRARILVTEVFLPQVRTLVRTR